MAAVWIHKVRTGSGSDRVVSVMLNYFRPQQILTLLEKTKEGMRRRIDPVATAPGSDFVYPHSGHIVAIRVLTQSL